MTNAEIARVAGEILAAIWLGWQTYLARKKAASAERKVDQALRILQQVVNRLQQAQSQAVNVNVYYAGVSGTADTRVKPPPEVPPPRVESESPSAPETG